MPSVARFCPNCGATNPRVTAYAAPATPPQEEPEPPAPPEPQVAATPAEPAIPAEPAAQAEPAAAETGAAIAAGASAFATPMAPPSFYSSEKGADSSSELDASAPEYSGKTDALAGVPASTTDMSKLDTLSPAPDSPAFEAAPADMDMGAATIRVEPSPSQAAAPGSGTPTVNIGAAPGYQTYSPPPVQQYGQTQQIGAFTPPPVAQPPAYQQYSPPPQPQGYQYQSQIGVAGTPPRDPTIALLLELIGYVGLLGIGHIYAGRLTRGIGLMIGWICYWAIVAFMFVIVVGVPIGCLMVIAWPFVPILSGLWIRNDVQRDNQIAGRRY
jgi:hypothetical protein